MNFFDKMSGVKTYMLLTVNSSKELKPHDVKIWKFKRCNIITFVNSIWHNLSIHYWLVSRHTSFSKQNFDEKITKIRKLEIKTHVILISLKRAGSTVLKTGLEFNTTFIFIKSVVYCRENRC